MDKQQKTIIIVFSFLLLAVLIAVIVVVACQKSTATGDFVPPPFESNAVSGVPDPLPKAFGTITVDSSFVIGACAFPAISGNSLEVYLTSHQNNGCWIKMRVYDEDKVLLGESGLLKPGEYVPSIELSHLPEGAKTLYATILSYEPDTYYSKGAVDVELRLTQ